MLKWLAGIDVNAVFLALMAAWGYIHNHNFRVQQTGTGKPISPAGAVATVLLLVFAVALTSCGSNAPAIEAAEGSCLKTYAPEIAAAFASATPQGDAVGIVLSAEAAVCLGKSLGARVVVIDAGKSPG
jgi:hypothetical protein